MNRRVLFTEALKGKSYDFLRTNERLGNRIILLSYGGSYAYGTYKQDGSSDLDVRGITLELPKDLSNISRRDVPFEQYVESSTDTTIYGINKIMKLLLENNPNTIEILGFEPEEYLYLNEFGRELVDNKTRLLSKKCIDSFSAYAGNQLARLENGLKRGNISQELQEKHLYTSLINALGSFNYKFASYNGGSFTLDMLENVSEDRAIEVCVNIALKGYPLRDITCMLNELLNIVHIQNKLNKRGRKKTDAALDKHAMHLIRLYMMVQDILKYGVIQTTRKEDVSLLLFIRNGGYRNADGTYKSEFFELVEQYKRIINELINITKLPDTPDYEWAQDYLIRVNKYIFMKS